MMSMDRTSRLFIVLLYVITRRQLVSISTWIDWSRSIKFTRQVSCTNQNMSISIRLYRQIFVVKSSNNNCWFNRYQCHALSCTRFITRIQCKHKPIANTSPLSKAILNEINHSLDYLNKYFIVPFVCCHVDIHSYKTTNRVCFMFIFVCSSFLLVWLTMNKLFSTQFNSKQHDFTSNMHRQVQCPSWIKNEIITIEADIHQTIVFIVHRIQLIEINMLSMNESYRL
jgi:hypothetical protein